MHKQKNRCKYKNNRGDSMRKRTLYILFGICAAAMLLGGCGSKYKANPLEKEGYVLDWHDEFDGTDLDLDKWLPQYLPHNTDSPEGCLCDYEVSDGTLKLIIEEDKGDYYTGEVLREDGGFVASCIQTYEKNGLHMKNINTTVAPFDGYRTQYGYFEARFKVPKCGGGGTFGWWMVGVEPEAKKNGLGSTQTGEIDIVEGYYANPRVYEPKVHPWSDPDLFEFHDSVVLPGKDDEYWDEFHTYAMDWTPEGLVFYVDGKEMSRTDQSPQYEMCILFSMFASYDPEYWGGGASDRVFPKIWEIDYVRVYKKEGGYPNGVTKPTDRASLGYTPVESEVYVISEGKEDPVIGLNINDRARHAELTTTGEHVSPTIFINGAGYNALNGTCSVDNPGLPAEYVFTWDTPQNVDMMNLYSYVANGQGPTGIELQVLKEGEDWKKVGDYEIEWKLLTATPEYAKLPIPDGDGVIAVKMLIKDANLMWKHYVIQKVHIYKEGEPYDAKAAVVVQKPKKGNVASSAKVTSNAGVDALERLNDGKYGDDNGYLNAWRPGEAADIEGKDYYQLNWSEAVSINKVVMAVTKARNQAPTAWRIEVSKDGQNDWTEIVSEKNVKWKELGGVIETLEMKFDTQEGIKGMRLWIDGANFEWGGYGIVELEVYEP